ncbi:MAG: sigma-E factor regulatory protein RseB domain-containing protein [Planctomycetota bacterium]|jgi:hypothetical protein
MHRSKRSVLAAALFAILFVPIAYAGFSEVRERRTVDILQPVIDAEKSLAIRGERRMISHREDAVLESVHHVFFSPPGRRHVVFREFRRNGEAAEPEGWWSGFFGGGKGGKKPGSKRSDVFHRMAGMAGWKLPPAGRIFFSARPRRFHDLELLARNYDVVVVREEPVAGRSARVVDIRPLVKGRAAYRLWADRETDFPLRYQVLDAAGSPVFESVYDSVEYDPEFAEGVFPEKRGGLHKVLVKMLGIQREATTVREAAGKLEFPVWEAGRPPAGTRLKDCAIVRLRLPAGWPGSDGEAPAEIGMLHATYTDGAAVVFLVEFSSTNPFWTMVRPMLEQRKQGGTPGGKLVVYRLSHRGGSAFLMERGTTVIVVAGNFPEPELLNMVKTLRRLP